MATQPAQSPVTVLVAEQIKGASAGGGSAGPVSALPAPQAIALSSMDAPSLILSLCAALPSSYPSGLSRALLCGLTFPSLGAGFCFDDPHLWYMPLRIISGGES